MTLEQLAEEYKQLFYVACAMSAALQRIDLLEKYPDERENKKRFWSHYNCWIYENEAIANVNFADIENSVEKFKEMMHNIDRNQELKMFLSGIDLKTINSPEK